MHDSFYMPPKIGNEAGSYSINEPRESITHERPSPSMRNKGLKIDEFSVDENSRKFLENAMFAAD